MRLRYLNLARCGPLTSVAAVFGREELVTRALKLERRGALNFVVGVNGSGKSSVLRAVYQAFTSLRSGRLPGVPLTLAWDIAPSDETVTAILHIPEEGKPVFVASKQIPNDTSMQGWQELALSLESELGVVDLDQVMDRGDDVLGSYLQAHLPKRLIAYTSGAAELWAKLEHRTFQLDSDTEVEYRSEDERPHGWSIEREWEVEQPARVAGLLTRFSQTTLPSSGANESAELPPEIARQLAQELRPLAHLSQKVAMNQTPREARLDQTYFRVAVPQLRFAAVALALVQAANELRGQNSVEQQAVLREMFLKQLTERTRTGTARDLLNRIDWAWPTHLSLVCRDDQERVSSRQHHELLCLTALAEEVIEQPRGRKRLVLPLGPRRGRLSDILALVFPDQVLPETVKFIAQRVDDCPTGAEAVLRVLSEDSQIDSTPLDAFTRLRDWERTGLLEEVTLTVKRLHTVQKRGDKPDDVFVTLDQMSDGEQVLIGRMGLLYLLRGQHGSLLLLDEPETHFNDAWKRELVEMMEAGLLQSTHAGVLVATHTSIALTDAFAAEVTVLDKGATETTVRQVRGGLFGTEPSEVTMQLFHAKGSAGSRSLAILNRLLATDWQGREEELEQILGVLGSSFHRAELRATLRSLQHPDAAPPSNSSP